VRRARPLHAHHMPGVLPGVLPTTPPQQCPRAHLPLALPVLTLLPSR